MGIFDSLFGKKLSKPRPDDVKMWRSGRVCEPCTCFAPRNGQFGNVQLHADVQDTNCEAWKLLESLVEKSVNNCSEEFAPAMEMPPEFWRQIITLPTSIAKLTSVKRLYLYGSNLVRLPPEIGLMENLEELDIYTSYRLHWLPYEVTRCKKLSRSRASTRAHYGNYKYRPPFPQLGHESLKNGFGSGTCSVCRQSYSAESVRQVWISLRVATDVFPLLVYACSTACILNLPRPPEGYVNHPHAGGIDLKQPDPRIPLKSVH